MAVGSVTADLFEAPRDVTGRGAVKVAREC